MPFGAKGVANYFLERAGLAKGAIRHMKLQKLLYYAHGYHLAIVDEPLLNEPIQAWEFGPVVPSIYHEFKFFGNDPITEFATEGHEDKDRFNQGKPIVPPPTDSDAVAIMDRVWEVYGSLQDFQLSEMTHEDGSPWHSTKKEKGVAKGTNIDDELIREYFLKNELNVAS